MQAHCQRCGQVLPPNDVRCQYCGYLHVPVQGNPAAQPPAGTQGQPFAPSGLPQNYGMPPFGQQGGSPVGFPSQQSFAPQQPIDSPFAPPASPANTGIPQYSPASLHKMYFPTQSGPFQYPPQGQSPFAASQGQRITGNLPFNPPPLNAPPPQDRSRKKNWLIIGLSVLAVLIISSVAIVAVMALSPQGIARQGAENELLKQPSSSAVFEETFKNNNQQWDTISEAGAFSATVGNGALTLEDNKNQLMWEMVPGNKNFSDFYLKVEAGLTKGQPTNGYGIYIRGAASQGSDLATFYRLELYGDGVFAIMKGVVNGDGSTKTEVLSPFHQHSAIKQKGEMNQLVIIAKGSTMTFAVNGEVLATVNDASYKSGKIALFVSNVTEATAGAQAQFKNLAIYNP